MVRVNRAYEEGDFAALQALADEWATGAGGPEGESVGEQLVRLIRQIFDVRSRLVSVDAEIESVKASDDYGLLQQAEEARLEGRDLTAEHVARMDEHIEELRSKIEDIKEQLQAV